MGSIRRKNTAITSRDYYFRVSASSQILLLFDVVFARCMESIWSIAHSCKKRGLPNTLKKYIFILFLESLIPSSTSLKSTAPKWAGCCYVNIFVGFNPLWRYGPQLLLCCFHSVCAEANSPSCQAQSFLAVTTSTDCSISTTWITALYYRGQLRLHHLKSYVYY